MKTLSKLFLILAGIAVAMLFAGKIKFAFELMIVAYVGAMLLYVYIFLKIKQSQKKS